MEGIWVNFLDQVHFFQFLKGRCHGNQIILPKWRQIDTTCILCTFARGQDSFVLLRLPTNATISCKILVKISPVISANILIEIALRVHVLVRRMSSNISGCTGPIFAIISPLWKRFTCRWWICRPTSFSNLSRALPWQPNNFAVMKVNWYYVHSLQFGRWSTVLFSYYLLGGDTVVPSGLLARLCHTFLV